MSKTSIPAKTLEHWASMYLSFRYRSRASLWWPAPGEDAKVSPAIAAGKVIPLEVTSSSFTSSGSRGYHSVTIDLKQLLSYRKQQIPVFYLIPFPRWNGEILGGGSQWLGDVSPSDLAFQRAGEPYFGNWTKVIHVGELLRVLKPLTKAYSAAPSQKTRYAELVRTPSDKGAPVWHKKLANKPRVTSWQDFWIGIDSGGRPDEPTWIVVPDGSAGTRATRTELITALAGASSPDAAQAGELYAPVVGDGKPYRKVAADDAVRLSVGGDSHLVLLELSASALHL